MNKLFLVLLLAAACATPTHCSQYPCEWSRPVIRGRTDPKYQATPPPDGGIALETPDPKYRDYFNKIRERIKAKWVYPRSAGERGIEGEVLIEFHIAKDGRLEYIVLRRSSGVPILDKYAMNAVTLAEPFPPIPDEIAKQTLSINGTFRYQIPRQ